MIKCCDISNEVRPFEVSEPWVDCLLEEYFNQVRTELLVKWSKFRIQNSEFKISDRMLDHLTI